MKRLSILAPVFVAFIAAALPADANAQSFDLVEATIDGIQAQYRAETLQPEDVVGMYLARIAKYDRSDAGQPLNLGVGQQPLNSFMHVNEHAIRDAQRLGDDFGDSDDGDDDDGGGKPLFGIPVIIKDNIATGDMPTTAGSVALGGSHPRKDASIARKLRRAGAIILGKATLTEFANFIALGMPTGFSSQLRFQLFQVPGANLSKVGFGFNSYDPRIDPRTPGPSRLRPTTAARCWRPEDPARDPAWRWAPTWPRSASARRLRDRSSARRVRTAWWESSRRSAWSADTASCPSLPIRTPLARWRGR